MNLGRAEIFGCKGFDEHKPTARDVLVKRGGWGGGEACGHGHRCGSHSRFTVQNSQQRDAGASVAGLHDTPFKLPHKSVDWQSADPDRLSVIVCALSLRENSCDQEIPNRQYDSVNETVAIIPNDSSVPIFLDRQKELMFTQCPGHRGKLGNGLQPLCLVWECWGMRGPGLDRRSVILKGSKSLLKRRENEHSGPPWPRPGYTVRLIVLWPELVSGLIWLYRMVETGFGCVSTGKEACLFYSQLRESTAKGAVQRWPNWNQGLHCLTYSTVFSIPDYIATAIVCLIPLKIAAHRSCRKETKKKWLIPFLRTDSE